MGRCVSLPQPHTETTRNPDEMNEASRSNEPARADLALLLPLRDSIARRAGALRIELMRAEPRRHDRLYSRALRYDRMVRLLDTRIRLAAELLARGEVAPIAAGVGARSEAS